MQLQIDINLSKKPNPIGGEYCPRLQKQSFSVGSYCHPQRPNGLVLFGRFCFSAGRSIRPRCRGPPLLFRFRLPQI